MSMGLRNLYYSPNTVKAMKQMAKGRDLLQVARMADDKCIHFSQKIWK